MARKTKTREITIVDEEGAFKTIFKKFSGEKNRTFDFEGLSVLRKILSNERARMLHIIKNQEPDSLYKLAKILNRDFKSVVTDIKMLEKFGFIGMISEKTGKRERLKPIVVVDSMYINIKI